MLNQNPFTSQAAVPQLFLDCQRMVFGFLEGCLAVFMQLRQSLIASICQNLNMLRDLAPVILEKLEIMFAPIAKGRGDNLSSLLVSDQLRFLGVSPLFAAVMPILAFFGCSIGCSLASTSTTSKTVSLGWSAFLPGKQNFLEWTSVSSTFWIVRQTADSLIP